jgi:hypothetical protein
MCCSCCQCAAGNHLVLWLVGCQGVLLMTTDTLTESVPGSLNSLAAPGHALTCPCTVHLIGLVLICVEKLLDLCRESPPPSSTWMMIGGVIAELFKTGMLMSESLVRVGRFKAVQARACLRPEFWPLANAS